MDDGNIGERERYINNYLRILEISFNMKYFNNEIAYIILGICHLNNEILDC